MPVSETVMLEREEVCKQRVQHRNEWVVACDLRVYAFEVLSE